MDFFKLVLDKNLELLKKELKGVDINSIFDINKRSLLFVATLINDINIVKFLLENGANPNLKNHSGDCALFQACRINNLELIKILIEKGASLKITNNIDETIYHIAFEKSDEKVLDYLDAFNIPFLETKFGLDFMHYAIKSGNQKVIDKLLLKINLNKKDIMKNSYLHYASRYSNIKLVEKLINLKLDINEFNTKFETPLFMALKSDDIKTFKFLIEKGAYLQIKNKDFHTVYDLAKINDLDNFIFYIEDYIEGQNYKNQLKNEIAIISVLNRDYWKLQELKLKKIDFNYKNLFGLNAKYYAEKYNFKTAIELIEK